MKMASNVFDSSSDEEFILELGETLLNVEKPVRKFKEHSNPFDDFGEEEFRVRFRLPKKAVVELMERIGDQLQYDTVRYGQVQPINQLLICLRFYASGSFQVQQYYRPTSIT